jgi:hypothetical protein
MARNFLPETGRTGTAILARWRKITKREEELVPKPGLVTWPSTGPTQSEEGKNTKPLKKKFQPRAEEDQRRGGRGRYYRCE